MTEIQHDQPVSAQDAYAVLEILAELHSEAFDLPTMRQRFLERAAALIDADAWVWICSAVEPDNSEVQPVFFNIRGICEKWFEKWVINRARDPERHTDPLVARIGEVFQPNAVQTWLRQDLFSDDEWYANPHVQFDRIRDCQLDHYLGTLYANAEFNLTSALGFHRKHGRPPFSIRDKRLLHLLSTEVRWLHQGIIPTSPSAIDVLDMNRQQKLVLMLLLSGNTRRTIAERLHLSPHTIDDYVKDLYRRTNTRNKNELIDRFLIGNGKDSAPPFEPREKHMLANAQKSEQ